MTSKTLAGRSGWASALAAALGLSVAMAQEIESSSAAPVDPALSAAPVTAPVAEAEQKQPEVAPPEEPSKRRNAIIEEVVVTAQKREENLSDVPISVSAFSGDALEARGIVDPRELAVATPGLTYSELVSYAIIYLRGVGSDAFVPTADTSVATYIDGVYFPFLHGLSQSFGAIERVEVLKGPQGTLFGRNSTGGAINIITKNPDDQFGGTAEASYETFDSLKTRFFVTGPLTDTFSYSLSGLYNNAERYHYKPGEPSVIRDYPGTETRGANLKLRWRPTDRSEAILSGYAIKSESSGTAILTNRETSLLGKALLIPTTNEDYIANTNRRDFVDVDFRVGTLTLRQDFDWFTVKTISAYQDLITFAQQDFDGSANDVVSFSPPSQFARVHTEELQFISPEEDSSFRWIGGLYYIESQAGYRPVSFRLFNSDDPIGALTGVQIQQILSDFDINLPPILSQPGARAQVHGSVDTQSYSVFAQGTYEPLDWLGITLGGRYQVEKRSIDDARTEAVFPDTLDGNIVQVIRFPRDSFRVTNFSPKATLDFKLADGTLLYAGYSRGFKSGTFNPINLIAAPDKLDPEVVQTVEVGFKGDWLDGALRVNGAVFQNTIDDVQVLVFSLTSGGIVSLENAGSARIRGAELDATWATPLDGLALFASTSFLDGVYTDYDDASGFVPSTGFFINQGFDFTGNPTVRTPDFTGNVGFNYNMPVWMGDLEFSADVYYNDGFYYDAGKQLPEKSYTLLNAHITYLYEPANLKFTLFGKNLADEIYTYARYQNDFGKLESLAPPRVVGLRINWEF